MITSFSCNATCQKESIGSLANTSEETTADSLGIDFPEKMENSGFAKIISELKFKPIPLTDSTNFDNFIRTRLYDESEVEILQLEEIYPDFYTEGYNFRTAVAYRIELSKDFHSIVLITFKGDHEIESILVNYDLDGRLIDYIVISYDEVAEGSSRTTSKIEKNKVTTTNIFWMDEKLVDVEIFAIDKHGEIKLLSN